MTYKKERELDATEEIDELYDNLNDIINQFHIEATPIDCYTHRILLDMVRSFHKCAETAIKKTLKES